MTVNAIGKPFVWPCVVLLVLVSSGFCGAEEPATTQRERELLTMMEKLEARVSELEQRLEAQAEGQQPAAALEQRVAQVEEAVEEGEKRGATDFRVFWKEGLRFETDDKKFKIRVGGRIQNDWAFFDQDRDLERVFGDENDGTEFRRARINLQGEIYDSVVFRAEYDFAGNTGDGKFKDVYIGLKNLPVVGNLRLGHFKEPFGLEQVASTNYPTFLECSLPDVFTPSYNLGLMAHNYALDGRLTWAVGAFKDVDNFPSDDDSDEDQGFNFTGRVTGLPWYRDDGRRLLHLGLAYSHRNPDGAVVGGWPQRWRQRPESHLANRYVDTGGFQGFRLIDARADDVDLFGAETALVYGPFSLQGEYMLAEVDTDFDGNRDFDGYYVQASYFLTGEHRPYQTSAASFGRVKPKDNFSLGKGKGWGALELALRYSSLDLDSGPIRGGQEDNFTLGANWYLNPNTRIMLNYVMADIDHDLYDGDLNILQSRFQVDF